ARLVEGEGGERTHCLFLGAEHISRGRFSGPIAARAGRSRVPEPDAGGRDELLLRPRASIGLAELEQRAVAETPVPVALGRADEARQERGAHGSKLGRDRIAQEKLCCAAAERLGTLRRDEPPGPS